jgi:LAS superfamily LD-carboxypeptidase LdcB
MSLLPIKKIVLPANLVGVQAGKLPSTMLLKVAGGGFLHPKAAKAWNALVAKAAADGIELKPTSAGDLYRSYDVQKRGFLTRYQTEPIEGASTRKFEGKVWYLKKGNAPLAAPGTSNHNLGIAIDVANASGKVLEWMKANIEAYGFSWELQEEAWHIRLVCGDNLPAVVTGA